ncbi:MAG: hypothetical protein PF482_19950 [Desulfobacteraceae bacterium]|nr:hypothetical protein [Desulfobacteraceae bacterium]
MNHLEMVRIRLFNLSDSHQVNILFQQFKESLNDIADHEAHIALWKNTYVENDWLIHLAFLNPSANKRILTQAAHLIEALRMIGMVNHERWDPVETIKK